MMIMTNSYTGGITMSAVYSRTSHWCDRNRILTMPLGSTYYDMNAIRISVTEGLFSQRNYNIPLRKIIDVKCNRGFGQMFVNQGDIVVTWRDMKVQTSTIKNIKDPWDVKNLILELSDEAKRRHYRGHLDFPPLPPEDLFEDDDLF